MGKKTGSPNASIHRTFQAIFEMPSTRDRPFLAKISRRQYRNPIYLAMEWERAISSGEYSSSASLAYHLGVSRARVTQVMNLLKLSPKALDVISGLGDPIGAHMITERSLRPLLALSDEQQKTQLEFVLSKDKHI
jgi:hypothetical protein